MEVIKLTQATWYEREYAKVKGVVTHQLTREGIEAETLARELKRYLGTDYTGPELVAFRNNLVVDDIIEVV